MAKLRVFVDTNIILEAFRTNTWTALCTLYRIETVEKCVREALAGNPDAPGRIQVDEKALCSGLAEVHCPTPLQRASFLTSREESEGLDEGESDLFAFIDDQGGVDEFVILLSTADKAAVVAAGNFGWSERLKSLEELLARSVSKAQMDNLQRHFRKTWLDQIKLDLIL